MKWSLIIVLSMFGLAMGLLTVSVIPSETEPFFWLAVFVVCAFVIARQCATRRFLHGLALGLVNSVWVTGSHVLFFSSYIANHAKEAAMMTSMPMPDSPRLMMTLTGPVIGLVSGVVLGLFALLAGLVVKPRGTI